MNYHDDLITGKMIYQKMYLEIRIELNMIFYKVFQEYRSFVTRVTNLFKNILLMC